MESEQELLQLKCMCDKRVVCESEANIRTSLHPSEVSVPRFCGKIILKQMSSLFGIYFL